MYYLSAFNRDLFKSYHFYILFLPFGKSFLIPSLYILEKKKNICTSSTFLYFSRFLPPYSTLTGSQNIHKPLILPCSIPQYFCAFLFLRAIFSAFCTKTIFPTSAIQPIQAVSSDKGVRKPCKEWHCFNLFLLPQSIGSDNRAHNHWLFIAQD